MPEGQAGTRTGNTPLSTVVGEEVRMQRLDVGAFHSKADTAGLGVACSGPAEGLSLSHPLSHTHIGIPENMGSQKGQPLCAQGSGSPGGLEGPRVPPPPSRSLTRAGTPTQEPVGCEPYLHASSLKELRPQGVP